MDYTTGRRIQADATAYGSQKRIANGGCPIFDEEIDGDISDPSTGAFKFLIPADRTNYLAAYCAGGYVARVETKNDNIEDGTRVQPDPVQLHPTRSRLADMKIDPTMAAFVAIGRTLDRAQADLIYLSGADKPAFVESLEKLSEDDRAALKLLLERKSLELLVRPNPLTRSRPVAW